MSHFTTMVFVEDQGYTREQAQEKAEELLEPFNENTEVPQYESNIWTTDEAIALRDKFADQLAEREDPTAEGVRKQSAYEYLRRWEAYDEADMLRDKGEGTYALLSTYNPDSQWDWYSLGGRWEGQLLIDGSIRPWGQIQDLDIAGARTIAGMKASERYDEFEKLTKGLEVPPTWTHIREEMFPGNIDAARAYYNELQWVKVVRNLAGFFGDLHEEFHVGSGGRKAMIEEARANAIASYAAVDTQGGWNAKGKMGWFGMSSGEDQEAWLVNFGKLLDSLKPADWWFQYDLHI